MRPCVAWLPACLVACLPGCLLAWALPLRRAALAPPACAGRGARTAGRRSAEPPGVRTNAPQAGPGRYRRPGARQRNPGPLRARRRAPARWQDPATKRKAGARAPREGRQNEAEAPQTRPMGRAPHPDGPRNARSRGGMRPTGRGEDARAAVPGLRRGPGPVAPVAPVTPVAPTTLQNRQPYDGRSGQTPGRARRTHRGTDAGGKRPGLKRSPPAPGKGGTRRVTALLRCTNPSRRREWEPERLTRGRGAGAGRPSEAEKTDKGTANTADARGRKLARPRRSGGAPIRGI